jgi:hypothetical protein
MARRVRTVLLVLLPLAGPAAAQDAVPEAPVAWAQLRKTRGGGKIRTLGGSGATENAVEHGLAWLAAHQNADGRWDSDGFMKHDPPDDLTDGAGAPEHDVAVTALAVLAFLGAGYDDGEEKYGARVRAGLDFLRKAQGEDGRFGPQDHRKWIYGHVLATAALAEAYGMRRDAACRRAAQRGLDVLVAGRSPAGGWRYDLPARASDTSVTAWCVLALHAGKAAGLRVDDAALAGARAFLEGMTDPKTGRTGYDAPGSPSFRPPALRDRFPPTQAEAATAAGLYARLLAGERTYASALKKSVKLCEERPPNWNPDAGSIDFVYWFFGTHALFHVRGRPWRVWNDALRRTATRNQHPRGSGARTGSWDPVGVWGRDGGRVYATALMTLTLQAYYRWPRK